MQSRHWKQRSHALCPSILHKLFHHMLQCDNLLVSYLSGGWHSLVLQDIPFYLFWESQQHVECWRSSFMSGKPVKKLSMQTTIPWSQSWARPFSLTPLALPVYTWKSNKYPQQEQATSHIFVPLFIGFIGRYCLKEFFPFPFTMCSSTLTYCPILYDCLNLSLIPSIKGLSLYSLSYVGSVWAGWLVLSAKWRFWL